MANGMFFSPEEALAAERQARLGTAMQAGATPIGAEAQELGRSLAGAVGGLFGAARPESPVVQKARTRQSLLSQIDLNDPAALANASRAAIQSGDIELGTSLADRYLALAKVASSGQVAPSDAFKRMSELVKQGEDPYVAQGIAYGMYRQFSDPSTGDIGYVDLRGNRPVGGSERGVVDKTIRQGTRQKERFETGVKDFGEIVQKSNVPSTESTLSGIEGYLSSLAAQGKKDIPGYGKTGLLPDIALTKEGQDLRTRLAKLFNVTLKDRSGAAVTSQELERLKKEFNTGAINTDRQLLEGLKIFRKELEDVKRGLASGYDPEIVNTYSQRSGVNFGKATAPKTKPTFKFNAATGKLEPM